MLARSFLFILLIVIGLNVSFPLFGQGKFTLSGEVKDATSGEYLAGAVIGIKELNTGVSSNVYGFYSITLPAGTYNASIFLLGYQDQQFTVVLNKDMVMNLELQPKLVELPDAVVQAERKQNTESTEMGRVNLEVDQIKKLPALLGEVDIL